MLGTSRRRQPLRPPAICQTALLRTSSPDRLEASTEVAALLLEENRPGSHRWMSQPKDGFPAWVRFDWSEPVKVLEVHLVFDTGMHRHLTLSHHDGYTASKMIWGKPQPETVRRYIIEARVNQHWTPLVKVTDNYLRLRRHVLPEAATTKSIRVSVEETHGLDHARILEVRVLGD